ncbi:MAG TPA: amidophosphoribosyltransferase [Candidatus Angelobacter sp.]|nr:amidophosphoribosyltransferase [Candidatus Angelobacter sp.]
MLSIESDPTHLTAMQTNDKFRDECGVFGVWGNADAVAHTLVGLTALQHRGQDSSGIAVTQGSQIHRVCRAGRTIHLVSDDEVRALQGHSAIGHVRYSTVGDSRLANAQPIVLNCPQGDIAICHNGQIVNFQDLKQELSNIGATWQSDSDTELVLQLCAMSKHSMIMDAILETLSLLQGAFALLLLVNSELIAARDRHGFRPLCLGRLNEGFVVCSETCALDAVGACYLREIEPGEVLAIGDAGITSRRYSSSLERAHCIFEHVYFARPDSHVFGENVGGVRTRLGRNLARESPADADVIVPVPDSGMWVGLGYQEESGLPLRLGLVRNNYVGRMFIEPAANRSKSNTKLKLNPVPAILAGQRVVLVDDSIVRGETMTRIVAAVREAGAIEVHVRIGCPPTIAPCYYGINTPTKAELIAARCSVEEIRRQIGADSLHYLSFEGLLDSMGDARSNYCTACYTGYYRVCPPHIGQTIQQSGPSRDQKGIAVSEKQHGMHTTDHLPHIAAKSGLLGFNHEAISATETACGVNHSGKPALADVLNKPV